MSNGTPSSFIRIKSTHSLQIQQSVTRAAGRQLKYALYVTLSPRLIVEEMISGFYECFTMPI